MRIKNFDWGWIIVKCDWNSGGGGGGWGLGVGAKAEKKLLKQT